MRTSLLVGACTGWRCGATRPVPASARSPGRSSRGRPRSAAAPGPAGGAGRTCGRPLSRGGSAPPRQGIGPAGTWRLPERGRRCRSSSAVRPPRRSSCTGVNSGQIRCTAATAVRSWAPCGPVKSILPLSGWELPGTRPPCGGRARDGGPGSATDGVRGPGRGGHGGRCRIHGGNRSLRVPTSSRRPTPAAAPSACGGRHPFPTSRPVPHPGECGAGPGWRVPT